MTYNILIVDDDRDFVGSVKAALKSFNVTAAFSINEANKIITENFDLILLDLVFDESKPDDMQGLDYIPSLLEKYPELQIVVMTKHISIETAVSAIKEGAKDFLDKGKLDWIEWKNRLENYSKNSARIRELKKRTVELELTYDETEIQGISKEIAFVKTRLQDLALNSSDVTLFLQGETGTGKNLAVKYFRKYSTRRNKAYKEFSLFELSDTLIESELFGHVKGAFTGAQNERMGLFEEANGGILFLDEIGDYDLRTQKKIMRFIEEKEITPVGGTQSKKLDIQLLMATNQDIPRLIAEGKFREDLYQRINKIKIELPPLKNRKSDITILADYFFHHFRVKEKTNLKSISPEVIEIFETYEWPGNIRELHSVIWDACTKARLLKDTVLETKHVREEIICTLTNTESKAKNFNLNSKKAMIELEEIEKLLGKTFGNKTKTAEMLLLSLDQLRYKVVKYSKTHPDLFQELQNIKKYYKVSL